MKFTLFSVKNKSSFKNVKNLIKLFSDVDISIFHFNEISEDMVHVVFNIKDEYIFGTKISGNQLNMPMNQYINSFYDSTSGLLFIEYVNERYCDEVSQYLKENNVDLQRYQLTNEIMLKTLTLYNGFIKKVELTDSSGEVFLFEVLSIDVLLDKISDEKTKILSLLMLSNKNFISLTEAGIVSINNNDLDYLTNFVRLFPYVENN
ncbi:hypothetical protein GMA19_03051 [Paenibacillus polymyxa E681]|nr:hypothetical protein [Paenibacillus polymyxa]ADM70857.1 hypothetical protein PPE_03034 [Paenibacillus polymyxa E681]QNV57880.1 hypothetical protein GE561_03051 [Paenibacillus polymyxa E681]QNV62717.1 hypothetical protein GMA19_03051 [Paenibacillus polymyxa E681]